MRSPAAQDAARQLLGLDSTYTVEEVDNLDGQSRANKTIRACNARKAPPRGPKDAIRRAPDYSSNLCPPTI